MSKRYTVDETWELCLKMWKWISRQCKGKSVAWCEANVYLLKSDWLEDNGYENTLISQHCFLCHHTTPLNSDEWNCKKCPAVKIDGNFDCMDDGNEFHNYPRQFYAELKRLNKIRLSK